MADDGHGSLSPKGRVKTLATAVVTLLIFLVGCWASFEKVGTAMDEGMLLVYPELVSHGQIPYRDFETFYGPANPYFLAGAFQLFGPHIFTERGVGLLYRVVVMVVIFGIVRRWGTVLGTGGMVIAGALLICTDLLASAWIGGVGCVLASLWVISSDFRARYFLAGLLGGLALLFRPDLGPALILSALPFLWCAVWRDRGHYFAGIALSLVPLAIVTLLAGIGNVWDNLFFYPVIVSNPGRRLPLSFAAPFVLRLLVLHLITGLVIVARAVSELRRNQRSVRGLLLFSMGILALCLTPQAMQRLDVGHFLYAAIASLPLLPVAVASLFQEKKTTARQNLMATAIVLGGIVLIGLMAPDVITRVHNGYTLGLSSSIQTAIFVEQNGRAFPFGNLEEARDATRLFKKLQAVSKPGERLFVGPADLRRTNYCDTFIYHLFPELRPASYFLEMNPFSANRRHSRLAADVSSADWLVLDQEMDNWREPNRSMEFGDDAPNRVVLTEFTPIAHYGTYVLFQRQAAPEKAPSSRKAAQLFLR